MPDGLTPCFIAKYVKLYENFHKLHPNMYTLKLLVNFVAHLTFHASKLKLFLCDEQRLDQKQRMRSKSDAIEHKFTIKIKGIFHPRQTHLKSKKYLVKYKGRHHKEVMWMKLALLDHLPKMVNKFD
jgi:hypothetical protein